MIFTRAALPHFNRIYDEIFRYRPVRRRLAAMNISAIYSGLKNGTIDWDDSFNLHQRHIILYRMYTVCGIGGVFTWPPFSNN